MRPWKPSFYDYQRLDPGLLYRIGLKAPLNAVF